jgi:hypothetical protein
LGTQCFREYFDPQEAEENCRMRSFIICTLHHRLLFSCIRYFLVFVNIFFLILFQRKLSLIVIISAGSNSTIVECAMHVGSNYVRIVHCMAHIHIYIYMCVDPDSLLTLSFTSFLSITSTITTGQPEKQWKMDQWDKCVENRIANSYKHIIL